MNHFFNSHNYSYDTNTVQTSAKTYVNKISYLDYSVLLERTTIQTEIASILESFDTECNNIHFKKGIYIYGSSGTGKTHFVTKLLERLGYDIVKYDAGDVRNKSLIDTITSNNVSNRNVLDMMKGKTKKIVVVMDEIDGMNNGDKGGINALIKLIRQKKTKKQRLESMTMNPIICIGNYYSDKKIRELMKVCHTFEIKRPTDEQMQVLMHNVLPQPFVDEQGFMLRNYIQGDIRKLSFIAELYRTKSHLLTPQILETIFQIKTYNDDAKTLTKSLINTYIPFKDHNIRMNDTDRTIVALLWHENIADALQDVSNQTKLPFYVKLMDNICYADYIDRITFQNQIWVFNEMSSLMKTFYNNKLFHEKFPEKAGSFHPSEIRFTKVLTKYSTEYNNQLFMNNLSQELYMDKKDVVAFFQEFRLSSPVGNYSDFLSNPENAHNITELMDDHNISKLDIRRMYRFLDKNVKRGAVLEDDDDDMDMDYVV
jgi:hypothetical protein